jgi:hypothetical protein
LHCSFVGRGRFTTEDTEGTERKKGMFNAKCEILKDERASTNCILAFSLCPRCPPWLN